MLALVANLDQPVYFDEIVKQKDSPPPQETLTLLHNLVADGYLEDLGSRRYEFQGQILKTWWRNRLALE